MDINFVLFFIFLVLFSKKIKKTILQKKIVLVDKELDGVDRDGIGNLEDSLRLMLINEECWNP